MMAERKGEDAFEFTNSATLMFGANRPPAIPEPSRAVKRRIVPIRFNQNFTAADDGNPQKRNKDELLSELTAEEEMKALLSMAIDGLQRLRDAGDVSLPETHDERLEYYEQFSDPIKEFRVQALESARGACVKKSNVYDAYASYCHANNYDPTAPGAFWRRLRETTLPVSESRPQIDGTQVRVIQNVKFTEIGLEHAPETLLGGNDDEEDQTEPISAVAAGDTGITLEGRVTDVESPKPDEVAEKATLVDETDEVVVTIWADANKPELSEGRCYRFKNVDVDEWDDELTVYVERSSGVQTIQHGVGHAPSKEPSGEQQDDLEGQTAADGGTAATSPDIPEDAEGPQAKAQQLVSILRGHRNDEFSQADILAQASVIDGVDDAEDASYLIEKAVDELGALAKTEDGYEVI